MVRSMRHGCKSGGRCVPLRLFDCLGLVIPAAAAAFLAGAEVLVGEGRGRLEAGLADWTRDVLRVGGSRNAEGEGILMVSMPEFAATASTHCECQTTSERTRATGRGKGEGREGKIDKKAGKNEAGGDGLLCQKDRPD